MQTFINAWKYRVARRAYREAAAASARLRREFCAPLSKQCRDGLAILDDMLEASRAEIRARRVMLNLEMEMAR